MRKLIQRTCEDPEKDVGADADAIIAQRENVSGNGKTRGANVPLMRIIGRQLPSGI
jgi:hypothetical protein